MAYYDALIAAWNSGTQPPSGVTGTALTGLTTANKLIAVNGWTVTGSVPTAISISAVQVFNCIDYTEFKALTDPKKSQMLAALAVAGPLLGGSANTGHLLVGMLLDFFTPGGATITALTALSKGLSQPWWQSNNYPRAFDMGDVTTAGLS